MKTNNTEKILELLSFAAIEQSFEAKIQSHLVFRSLTLQIFGTE